MADDARGLRVSGLPEQYRIDGELGSGGMAVVYAAVDVRHDRRVAIKVLRPEISASPIRSSIDVRAFRRGSRMRS